MLPMKRMLSEKGHELIVVNNYKYRQYRVAKRSGETCWCCTKKNCRAKIYTVGSELVITQQKGEHEHKPLSSTLLNRQQINNAITSKVKRSGENKIGPCNLIHDEIQTNEHVLQTFGISDMKYISTNLNQTKLMSNRQETEQNLYDQPMDDHLETVDIKVFPVFHMENFNISSYTIGFIGGGNMATAIATGILKNQITKPERIWVSSLTEATKERWKKDLNVNVALDNGEIFKKCDIIVLAVKPQVLDDALAQTLKTYSQTKIRSYVISVLAGVTLESLSQKLAPFNPIQIIRTIPNTPLMVSEGITVYSYEENMSGAPKVVDEIIKALFSTTGIAEKVPEKLINPISALSGSGPAYVYLMIEALADGAVRMGVPRAMANKYAAQVMVGAGQMVLKTGKHPGLLKDEVCSPNGTTITGIHALERGGVRGHLMNAVEAATRRSDELSKS